VGFDFDELTSEGNANLGGSYQIPLLIERVIK
jgi:hypothetical protein